jgi:outer membrane autotransporter protein
LFKRQIAQAATASAFSLSNGSVMASAYQYYLFRGGVTAGTQDNWYLRSSVPAAPIAESPDSAVISTPAPNTPALQYLLLPVLLRSLCTAPRSRFTRQSQPWRAN